jgi:exodeoxyribonuclease VII small subunit
MAEQPSESEPTFEAILERLGQMAKELEKSDVPLEKALALFEEGVGLVRGAEERLERAETRLEELTGKARTEADSKRR